jgi:amino acid adenylation domain-containing protein
MNSDKQVVELLKISREKGISITLEDERLQLKVAKDKVIDPAFINELRSKKNEILSFLHAEAGNFKKIAASGERIMPVDRSVITTIPLSYSQESIWLVDKLHQESVHRMPMILRFSGALDIVALEKALREIVNRHEVLRTVIKEEDGVPCQVILPENTWRLEYVKEIPAGQTPDSLIDEELQKRFDLSADLMMRARLIALPNDEYILVLITHHIASDGSSQSVFAREVTQLYHAFHTGSPHTLPPLPVQYADYAVWQRSYLSGDELEKQLLFWKNKLNGITPLNLPLDFTRPAIQSTRGLAKTMLLDKSLTGKLHEYAKHEDVTLYMLLLTAFNMLLYNYSGENDICVGTPVANRTQKELEPLIGYFVNSIPIRTFISSEIKFSELLAYVKKEVLEAYNHQNVPFERIANSVEKNKAPDRHPVFQVMFALQNFEAVKDVTLPGVELSRYNSGFDDATVVEFDITVMITDTPYGLDINFSYCADLFLPVTIEKMLDNYKTLLTEVIAHPQREVGSISMLAPHEKQELAKGVSIAAGNYPVDKTLVDLFQEQVSRTPDNIAVSYGEQTLTYAQLNEKANQLAHYLCEEGIKKEMVVAVCIDRSPEMMVALLGVMKSGAAYAAILPQYPPERIKYILDDTGAVMILSNTQCKALFQNQATFKCVDIDEWQRIQHYSITNPSTVAQPDNLIYVVYTSGSTGRPKGVMTEHRSLVNFLYAMIEKLSIDEKAAFLGLAAYTFDGSCMEIYLPLLTGGKVIMVDQPAVTDGYLLKELITKTNPTHIQGTPTALQLLLESGWANTNNAVILSGGEPLTENLRKSLTEISNVVWNLYGPTEITLYATMKEVSPFGKITAGKPIPNYVVYIVNPNDQLVPAGVAGEILVGGIGVARGYLNQPALTREKFIKNPFNEHMAQRVYRTGDVGRWNKDGELELFGRRDNQVKLRGFRIEPGEIESVLLGSGMVKQCTVLAGDDAKGNKRLVAYVIPIGVFDKKGLRDYLKTVLPDYMIPAAIIAVEKFYLTSNGKLDKRKLPDPDTAEVSAGAYVPHRNHTEEILVAMWRELLPVEQIGINDNFFESGGNSLLAVRLMARIKNKFNKEFPITLLFDSPTISQLAEKLFYSGAVNTSSLLHVMNKGGGRPPMFCTPAVGGEPVSFYELSKCLGDDQPVFAFSARGLDGMEAPHSTIREMAEAYIREMQQADPHGPYILAGYSFGAKTAYEMALLLQERGFAIKLLVIFDALSPDTKVIDYSEVLPQCYADWLVAMAKIINLSFNADPSRQVILTPEQLQGHDEGAQFEIFYKAILASGQEVTKDQLKGHVDVYIRNSGISYVPLSSLRDVPVVLFKSTATKSVAFDPELVRKREALFASVMSKDDYGWSGFTSGGVTVYHLPCSHLEMMNKPFVVEIANLLSKTI